MNDVTVSRLVILCHTIHIGRSLVSVPKFSQIRKDCIFLDSNFSFLLSSADFSPERLIPFLNEWGGTALGMPKLALLPPNAITLCVIYIERR
jgi:hypothetical protein